MNPARANHLAISLVAVGVIALALVLGLWQNVDAACDGEDFDPADPVATCQPPDEVERGNVAVDP
ncbi:hypothetical protein [Nitriliruptor alkaliphilus]|uniref:hypothetical protein n=1 Tax=Nitriliruptor alkaliphilus TaxID=427918 RepID=UPI000698970B|nr:hypothetical protein [Nitriliruptor alkaliphilus]